MWETASGVASGQLPVAGVALSLRHMETNRLNQREKIYIDTYLSVINIEYKILMPALRSGSGM
jgi:hypothetical protein